jgi:hypothetical protein
MTPTAALLSLTTDVIMQIQMAGLLGRVPCAASVLVNVTHSEMELSKVFTDSPKVDTPCVSISELASGVTASEAAASSAIVTFVKAAAARGDTRLPHSHACFARDEVGAMRCASKQVSLKILCSVQVCLGHCHISLSACVQELGTALTMQA